VHFAKLVDVEAQFRERDVFVVGGFSGCFVYAELHLQRFQLWFLATAQEAIMPDLST
jgi:hypothetical protein